MLKEQSTIVRRLVIILDLFLVSVSFPLAFYFRFQRFPLRSDLQHYGLIVLVFIPLFLFSLYRQKLYHQLRFITFFNIVKKVTSSFVVAFSLAAALLFLSHATYYSRLLFLIFSTLSFLLILLGKVGLKIFLNRMRRKGYNFRQALLVGSGKKLAELEKFFQQRGSYGIKVSHTLDVSAATPVHFEHLLTHNVIDEIYFALDRHAPGPPFPIDIYLDIAEQAGKTSKIILNISEHRHSSCDFARLADFPLVVLHPVTLDPDQILIKRLVDIAGALVGMALNMLLFPVLALAIKLDSPGPIFFVQQRVGENGRLFSLYKYRSMTVDAEERKKELADQNELKGAVFKLTNDPRVTRVGRLLRKLSLDELPQFWNVLKGEMSLVGTRPPTPAEVADYQLQHYRRLSIKPGLTGMWQVSGRNRITDFDQVVVLDTKYIDQWSLWLDVKIILKTIVVLGSGK
jgi:exopolysaccharide biosynthesis polyprenyl glycosylphosphotransferase